ADVGVPGRADPRVGAERTKLEALRDFEGRGAVEGQALREAVSPEDRGVGRSVLVDVGEVVVTSPERAGQFAGTDQTREVEGIRSDASVQAQVRLDSHAG